MPHLPPELLSSGNLNPGRILSWTHHVHDSEDEPLCSLCPVVLHHVCISHHQGLHRMLIGEPDGIPPLPPVPRWLVLLGLLF